MQLFFMPLACSMATRVALDDAGLEADYVEVDPLTKTIRADGADYREIHPLALVPALRTDEGELLTENVAVLWHVAEAAKAVPDSRRDQALLREWLAFTATELHKGVFSPLFDRSADDTVRAFAVRKSQGRLAHLDARLGPDREYLVGDSFSVADAYLVTVLHWARATPVELPPNALAYLKRHLKRPSVAAAIEREMPLFVAEKKREKQARATA